MFNDFSLDDNNHDNELNYWEMDHNSIFSTSKDDLAMNLFEEPMKKSPILHNNFSFPDRNSSTENNTKIAKDECKQQTTEMDENPKVKKKLFKVKKYVEYDEILKEIYSEGEENNEEISKTKNKLLNRKRLTFKKKEDTFAKLSQKEKVEKLGQLSKLVKRYRRKYTCLQSKIKNNITKIFQKYIYEKLKINYKNKYLNHNLNVDLYQVVKSLRKLHSANNFEYSDQKYVLENMVNLIADNKIPLDSINFKKICTQVRLMLPKEKVKHINKKVSQITVQFADREIKITKKEYDTYFSYINNNDVLKRILGLENESVSSPHYANNVNNYSANKLQLIPIITLPYMNFQEMINKNKILLFGGNDNNGMFSLFSNGSNTTVDRTVDSYSEQNNQVDPQNSLLNTYFLADDEGNCQ